MLIHTSGKKVDHSGDYKQVMNVMNALANKDDKNFEKYVKQLWQIAERRYGTSGMADNITSYIIDNISN